MTFSGRRGAHRTLARLIPICSREHFIEDLILKEVMGVWMSDTVSHDSHLLVIRKRALPRTRGIAMQHAEKRAMRQRGIRPLRDWARDPLNSTDTRE